MEIFAAVNKPRFKGFAINAIQSRLLQVLSGDKRLFGTLVGTNLVIQGRKYLVNLNNFTKKVYG